MSVRIGIIAGFALFLALAPLAAAEEPTGFRVGMGHHQGDYHQRGVVVPRAEPGRRGADDDLLPALSGRRGRHPGHPGLPPGPRAAGSARPLHRAAVLRELHPSRLPDGVCRTGVPPDAPRSSLSMASTTRRGRPVPGLRGAFGSSRGRLRGYLRRSLHGAYMAC